MRFVAYNKPLRIMDMQKNECRKHMRKQEGLFPATRSTLRSFKVLLRFYLVFTVCN